MHLHTVHMEYSECLPTLLNPMAERICFSQVWEWRTVTDEDGRWGWQPMEPAVSLAMDEAQAARAPTASFQSASAGEKGVRSSLVHPLSHTKFDRH